MSVKSPSKSTNLTQTPPDVPSLDAVHRVDSPRDKTTDSEDEVVDFSSGKVVTAIGYIMWLIILVANLYVLATL